MLRRDVPRASETAWFRGGSCQTMNERGSQGVNGRGSQGRGTHFSSSLSGTPQRLPAEMRKQKGMAGAGAGPCGVQICSLSWEERGGPAARLWVPLNTAAWLRGATCELLWADASLSQEGVPPAPKKWACGGGARTTL